jgi:hypothetical protein
MRQDLLRWPAVVIAILCALTSRAAGAADSLPPDVAKFAERRDICDHFRGEPFEGDAARRAFVFSQANAYCAATDKELARLRRKYSGDRRVLGRLDAYESCIEESSDCR